MGQSDYAISRSSFLLPIHRILANALNLQNTCLHVTNNIIYRSTSYYTQVQRGLELLSGRLTEHTTVVKPQSK